jgi:SAM-dependent methyltransferase
VKPHLTLARHYWETIVRPGDTLIDATLGNGQDTLFLAQLLKGKGSLTGYDIQPQAIENATKRLEELPLCLGKIISLKLKSHEQFEEKNVRLIVYNLGYLPGGNKTVTTVASSTLLSLESALDCLLPEGAISITCYPRHEAGGKEEVAVKEFLRSLPRTTWSVCHHQWLNRPLAPSLIWLRRVPDA